MFISFEASRTETVGESSQRSSSPTHSSNGYIPASSTHQPEPQIFVLRAPSVNPPSYHFDPYALGPSYSYVDHGMSHLQMYSSLSQYMLNPYTPTPYKYNMSYSGDPSLMNLLTMTQHVLFPNSIQEASILRSFYLLFLRASVAEVSRVKRQRKRINLLDVIQWKTSYLNNLNRMY
ncbi:hypothetical protein Syun_006049 [Stephania yunnanensis]|uniref:Uncharacterized protein n=1 Tax=Stephania yunnanensis TaxID=152371 RepID=A0AAP0KXC0_9MAGN